MGAVSSLQVPLRILILSPHPEVFGGVVNFVELLKLRLSADTVAESFFIARRPGERGTIKILIRLFWDCTRLMFRLLRSRYDVVHLNPSLNTKSVLRDGVFLAILKLVRCRCVFISFQGWDTKLEQRIFGHRWTRSLFCWLFGGAARIAVQSKKFKHALASVGCDPRLIVVMPTMFDGDTIDAARKKRPADAPRRSILFLARFARDKGVYELVEAFARIAGDFPDIEFVMAGDGEEIDGVKQRVAELGLADRVRFPGYVRDLDKANLLLDARVYVLPTSHQEGLPNSILEAMGAGAVIITSRTGGIAEFVHAPDNGILLDKISPDSIADALFRIIDDASYIAEVSANNQTIARRQFEANVVTQRLESLYREIALGLGEANR